MLYATFVLPAPNGCNLNCSFCAIAQRGEATESRLIHADYVRFLTETLTHFKVGRVGIQGYEALLPETWPLTRELLRMAATCFCETSLITNGVLLEKHVPELAELLDSATVSLDSDRAEIHDTLRGVKGAHEKAVVGLRALAKAFAGRRVTVASVLFPGKAHHLVAMPELLSSVGVTEWLISPLINFRKGEHVPEAAFIRETILSLAEKASRYGVRVLLSDELRKLEQTADLYKVLSLEALEGGDDFFRLSPDGSCSRGVEALGLASHAPIWDTATPAELFLKRIFGEVGQKLAERSCTLLPRAALRLMR